MHPWPLPKFLSSSPDSPPSYRETPLSPTTPHWGKFCSSCKGNNISNWPPSPLPRQHAPPSSLSPCTSPGSLSRCLCGFPFLARTTPLTLGSSTRMRSCLQGKVAQAGGRCRAWRRGTGCSALGGRVEIRGRGEDAVPHGLGLNP